MRAKNAAAVLFAAWLGLGCSALAEAPSADEPAASMDVTSEDVDVAGDGSYVVTMHTEIRAVNEAGAMQASRVSVFYDSETQQAEVVEAHTLKRDGRSIPVELNTIYEQLPSDNMLAVTSFRVKVILFPQFSAGDTAVYTVRLRNPRAMFDGAFQYGKVFPREAAYKDARVSITAPTAMALRIETHDLPFAKEIKGDRTVYTWRLSAPAQTVTSTAMVSPLDRERRFFVSSFKDYADLGRAYAVQSAPRAAVTPKIQALADQITAGVTDKREQARLLYEWVVTNIRYVAIILGRGSFVPHEADAVIAKGYGDCKDHDVLLQALLKAKAIAAQSILINGENAYTLSEAPSFAQLNHVITYLPQFDVYLDASSPVAPFGVLPQNEYGKPAVRAVGAGAGLLTLPMPKPGSATLHTETVQKIDGEGTITGTTTTTATGTYALSLRYIGLAVQALGSEQAAALQLKARGFADGTGKLLADPLSPLGERYKVRGEFTVKGWKSVLGGSTIMPGGLRVMPVTGDGIAGPLYGGDELAAEATACINGDADEDVTLEVPDGYSVRDVPKDERITAPNIVFTAHWTLTGNKLTVHRTFSSTVTAAVCSGALRKQIAAALKRIAATYDNNFSIAKSGAVQGNADPKRNEARTHILAGNTRLDANDFDGALKEYDTALQIDPNYAWAWNGRGVAHMRQGKFLEAIADLDRAIAIDPKYQEALYNRGDSKLSIGRFDQAGSDLDAALKLDPNDIYTLIDRGMAYSGLGQHEKAVQTFDTAIAVDPNRAASYSARATAKLNMGRTAAALADCAEALKRDPKDARALTVRAVIAMNDGRNTAALKDLDAALASQPKDIFALTTRAQIYQLLGKNAQAAADYNTLLSARPNDLTTLKLRAELNRKLKNYALALADYERLHVEARDLASEGGRLATLIDLGRTDEARAQCKKLVADNPNDGWPLIACSMMKRRLGDNAGANQDVAKALKIDPSLAKNGSVW